MRTYFKFFVVDPIMESTVGSFEAPSISAAKQIFKKSVLDNEKFKSYGTSLVLYQDPTNLYSCETIKEIYQNCVSINLEVMSDEVKKDE